MSTSTTPCAASMKVAALACRLIPIRWGVSTTSGWSNSGWCSGVLGVQDVEPHPAEPAVLQRRVDPPSRSVRPPRPQLTRTAPGLTVTEQPRTRPDDGWTSQQRQMQGDHVAAADQVLQVCAADIGRGFADRVVGQDLHSQAAPRTAARCPIRPYPTTPRTDPLSHRPRRCRGPPTARRSPGGEPTEALDQVHRHGNRTLGQRVVPAPGVITTATPRAVAVFHVHPLDAHSGPRRRPVTAGCGPGARCLPGHPPDDGALRRARSASVGPR